MATFRAIIQDSLREIRVLSGQDPPPGWMMAFCLNRANLLLNSWQAEEHTIFVSNRVTFTLLAGTNEMTIGETLPVDIQRQRPVYITAINYIIPGTSPAVESASGLGRMDDESYASLSIKELTSSLPTQFYYNATVPNGTLFFWPTVDQNVEMAAYLPTGMADGVGYDDDFTGPPGAPEAFMYQLAIRLASPFGRIVTPELKAQATDALARFKRPNIRPPLLGVDAALVPRSGSGYNILTDTTGSNR